MFKLDRKDWLHPNLSCNKLITDRCPNYIFFAVVLWFIWKWRCDIIFNSNFKIPSGPAMFILRYVETWLNATNDMDKEFDLKTCLLSWKPLSQDWVKLNVDGSMSPGLGCIVGGGVMRDPQKNWLGGFAPNKGLGSVIEVEL
ncbi:hypothetical protein Dsin_017283 [Dipteronia sinensis]|uniref:Uncharacterized protein n=1 Tax=Dipteronia sinensis TaxID=43782 RepID=A0AAE0AFY7_9ROSI|nr:hypothetical protein Dsin_017283 [Dipteronia sinensis]